MNSYRSINSDWRDTDMTCPDDNEEVLCFCKTGKYDILTWNQSRGIWIGEANYIHQKSFVTHWASLPEPPIPELKACPSCGGVGIFDDYDLFGVYCIHCGYKTDFYNTRRNAALAWNTCTPKERSGEK